MLLRFCLFLVLSGSLSLAVAQKEYTYETFENDPYNTRIYTLDNGLKVYLSVYDDEPRIQTYVSVRVGSRHDPAETTGLAHYFEHLMFKGTSTFGTINWEAEAPLLDKIEALFEVYRAETDTEIRARIYREIDSISYIASTYAIPNEYQRLMSAIGSTGTNAFTSNDFTSYIENIPSNQLEFWAMIQANRFSDPVIRLFHTELETVYEEKNMSLTNDARQASEALYRGLFPYHPYGTQTTLGDAEHLKNPSITNIKRFFEQYYVPNNMAVVMSGDFDPDEAIIIIDKHFGSLKPRPLPELSFPEQPTITQPVELEVVGLQAENLMMGWRFDGINSDDMPMLNMIRMILSNGRAGLIDQNLNRNMRVQAANASVRNMVDYSVFTLAGRNNRDQSLDEVRELLLEQLELLKRGEFPDWLLEAAINNLRLQEMRSVESYRSRAAIINRAFMNSRDYEDVIRYIDRLSTITREQVVEFANKHFRTDNYVVVYKRQGQPQFEPVEKPEITPIHINRDDESPLLQMVKAATIEPLEPVFLNYETDVSTATTSNNLNVFYAHNDANPTFSLLYRWEKGSHHNKVLPFAGSFINYIGTDTLSAEEIANAFYRLACSFRVQVGNEQTTISLSGLSENMEAAMELLEHLIMDAQPDEDALARFVDSRKKARHDSKADQRTNLSALVSYATYGRDNPRRFTLTDEELDQLAAADLIESLKNLWEYEHEVIFYGPEPIEEITRIVDKIHETPQQLKPTERLSRFTPLETTENRVFFAHYDANQSFLQTVSKGKPYDPEMVAVARLYNTYFGGGMNAIVFQEMREKRGLAYSAWARYITPAWPDEHYRNTSFIATQNDKVVDAFSAFNELFDNMPLSESSFRLAQEQMISNIRNQRIRDTQIIFNFLTARRMGHTEDIRKALFEQIPLLTLQDVSAFNQQFIQNQPRTYIILGNENLIDFEEVERLFGPVTRLSAEDLFVF